MNTSKDFKVSHSELQEAMGIYETVETAMKMYFDVFGISPVNSHPIPQNSNVQFSFSNISTK